MPTTTTIRSDVTNVDSTRLMLGDCLDRMGEIADGSIDLVLCDLPYGTTACKWDQVIPFDPLWAHYRRLLKPRGAVVLTASQPFTSMLVLSNREWFKYCLVWEKSNGTDFLNVRHRPLKAHEDVAVFSPAASTYSRRGSMTFNPLKWHGRDGGPDRPYAKKCKPDGWPFHTDPTCTGIRRGGTERCPRSVFRVPGVNDAQTDRHGHPTQKPVPLGEYLIETYSNEGDMVLDNCMGSGSFGVAAVNTGRRFIGIEKDAGYFAVASRRIAELRDSAPLLSGIA